MPLLDTPELTPAQLAQQRKSAVQQAVSFLRSTPRQTFDSLLSSYAKGVAYIWSDPAPAEVLAALGTDGAELFRISEATATFLESLKPGCTKDILSKVQATRVDPSGVVTLV